MPGEPGGERAGRDPGPSRIYPGYVFDLDGTVYLGDALLPHAAETIAAIFVGAGSRIVYVTNKPLQTADDYASKLTRLGVPTTRADVVTSVDALVDYLEREHPGKPSLAVAERSTIDELRRAGFTVTTDPSPAAGRGRLVRPHLRLREAERRLPGGALPRRDASSPPTPIPYCPTPDGGLPDCAAMLAAIEACTGAKAEAVVGKPSIHMARALLGRLGTARPRRRC